MGGGYCLIYCITLPNSIFQLYYGFLSQKGYGCINFDIHFVLHSQEQLTVYSFVLFAQLFRWKCQIYSFYVFFDAELCCGLFFIVFISITEKKDKVDASFDIVGVEIQEESLFWVKFKYIVSGVFHLQSLVVRRTVLEMKIGKFC